jgi:hypothetical protein
LACRELDEALGLTVLGGGSAERDRGQKPSPAESGIQSWSGKKSSMALAELILVPNQPIKAGSIHQFFELGKIHLDDPPPKI